jgi:hypothetical protein
VLLLANGEGPPGLTAAPLSEPGEMLAKLLTGVKIYLYKNRSLHKARVTFYIEGGNRQVPVTER